MRIGLTYDLASEYAAMGLRGEDIAEFDSPETIDGLSAALQELGYTVDRVGSLPSLVRRLASGDRWDLVFNIAEGWRGSARESQVPSLLDAYDIPYTFSDPLMLAIALHKGHTKTVLQARGVATAPFAVVTRLDEVEQIDLPLPLFIKPVGEGTGKGTSTHSRITSREGLREGCAALLERYRQPVLVERLLTGREFTVGITGTGDEARVLGVMEIMFRTEQAEEQVYSYAVKNEYRRHVSYALVDDAEGRAAGELALRAWRVLGCCDGGRVDLRSDGEVPMFLEVNPLAGLNPAHSDLPILCRLAEIPYRSLIEQIVVSARRRIERRRLRAAAE